jgi:hypothetical protein
MNLDIVERRLLKKMRKIRLLLFFHSYAISDDLNVPEKNEIKGFWTQDFVECLLGGIVPFQEVGA